MENKTPTPIRREINCDSFFYPFARFWNDYFVFYAVFWRATIFILLIASAVFLWPYAPLLIGDADERLPIPVETLRVNKGNMAVYPSGVTDDAIQFTLETQEYVAPGRPAKFSFYLRQTNPIPTEDQKIVFKVVPGEDLAIENEIPAAIGEAVLTPTKPGHWQATTNITLDVPPNYTKKTLAFTVLVETKPNCLKEEADGQEEQKPECKTPPITLESKEYHIRVVRWPNYMAQLLVFVCALGFFSIDQVGPAILKLLFPGRPEKQ